ncbi:MAG: kelch repeat-containing protein [Thermoanaerobaculia bacterium]|nr:kelch repeat-containing protein [Thermoanaerobaculia bacterium]
MRWKSLLLGSCALGILSLPPAPACADRVWRQVAASRPSPRHPGALAYDRARGVTLLFGGWNGDSFDDFGSTWEWNGGRWKRVSRSGPPPRESRGFVYDSAREVAVLFGGLACGEPCRAGDFRQREALGDTWEWNGKRWNQVASSGPSPRNAHMVYDSGRGVSVLYGGDGPEDTWEWDGESWTDVTPDAGPGPLSAFGMAYDRRRGVTVLFSGVDEVTRDCDPETWEWDGSRWTLVSSRGPAARYLSTMTYDERRGAVVLFGGIECGTDQALDDTWEFDGRKWKRVDIEAPSARNWHGMAYDAARGAIVLFGGREYTEDPTGEDLGDTWLLGSAVSSAHSDYDGDGAADPAVYDPRSKRWKIRSVKGFKFGSANGIPVPGDYDGDARTDAADFQASIGTWRVRQQFELEGFGQAGDLPAPADYDGDGATDLALFRPSEGVWLFADPAAVAAAIAASANGTPFSAPVRTDELELGRLGDLPIPGDYDGDGRAEPAVYRPATRQWIVHGGGTLRFGKSGDIPIPADYDGDGTTDIATWRPSAAKWTVRGGRRARLGAPGHIPVPADYDGDGACDFAVYDPATGNWSVDDQFALRHGKPGQLPLLQGR